MKITFVRTLMAIVLMGFFTQVSVAQDENENALKEVADIVTSINHFPSDADKAALANIAANETLPQGIRDMATTVANIAHVANDEGKVAMARIQASDNAPDRVKVLAGMIASFNHMLSKEEKTTLARLFP